MTPLDLRVRRRKLGLSIAEVASAAKLHAWSVVNPTLAQIQQIDAALAVVEAGGTLETARAASRSKPGTVPRETPPPWPEHTGRENLSGQCFQDVGPRKSGRAG